MGIEYIILIYAAGLAMIIAEVFLPGGLLGVAGAIALVVSIYLGFNEYGLWVGLIQLGITVTVIPLAFFYGLKRLSLSSSLKTEDGFISSKAELEKLTDKEGVAITNLRPAGIALIDGRKVDVVTEGSMIDKNTPVKVISVEGVKIIVRVK
jgi:membrane-bound serine protease (ClpP class)